MNRQTLSLLSLCQRAGKMKTGEDTVEKAIQKKKLSWLLFQKMLLTIQKRNLQINVNIMMCRF